MFTSTDLAARIERAECDLLKASVEAVAERRPDRGASALAVRGGVAAYSGEGSPLNKVAGLGFDGSPDPSELERIERFYRGRACPVQVELSSLADPDTLHGLMERGYRLVAFENVLGRDLMDASPGAPKATLRRDPEQAPPATGVEIVDVGEPDFRLWLDTVVTGFLNPDADGIPAHESFARDVLEEVMGDMASAAGFRRYLARLETEPAGAASMRVHGGVAHLAGAATLPRHRKKGVQTALLARRLSDAARAGCDVAVLVAQPGSMSHRNAQRNGFALLYARAILLLEHVR